MADHIPQLVQGVRSSQANPEDLSAQLALIIASQNFLQVQFRDTQTMILQIFSESAKVYFCPNSVLHEAVLGYKYCFFWDCLNRPLACVCEAAAIGMP